MGVVKIKKQNERTNWKTIKYLRNQYSEGELAIVKDIGHLLMEDTIHRRYFVINMNNQIIYLDQFLEDALVGLDNQQQIKINFSELNNATINKNT